MPINGTATVEAARATGGFPNVPEFGKTIEYEMRQKSVFGALSNAMPGKTTSLLGMDRGSDLSATNVVMRKSITKGDEADFTMVKNLDGSPTYGDLDPEQGEYLDFLYKKLRVNAISSPDYPLQSRMNLQRLMTGVPGDVGTMLRDRIMDWNKDQYVIDCYRSYFRGASDNILRPKTEGGLAQDLGAGAGSQVSPLNVIALGTGAWQAKEKASLAAHETALNTAIDTLSTANADHLINYSNLQDVAHYLPRMNLKGLDAGGSEKFVLLIGPSAFKTLVGYDSQLQKIYSASDARSKDNPAFGFKWLDIGPFMVYVDPWIEKFYPDATGSDIVWGTNAKNPRNFQPTGSQATKGVGLILGTGAIMEATNGTINIDEGEDKFKRNFSYSSYAIRAHMRSMWKPEDGSTTIPIDQSSALLLFADPGFTF